MKIINAFALALLISASAALAQAPGDKPITVYNPADALHPFKLFSLLIRPPVALLEVIVRGGYNAADYDPVRRAFNIDFRQTINIDEDY